MLRICEAWIIILVISVIVNGWRFNIPSPRIGKSVSQPRVFPSSVKWIKSSRIPSYTSIHATKTDTDDGLGLVSNTNPNNLPQYPDFKGESKLLSRSSIEGLMKNLKSRVIPVAAAATAYGLTPSSLQRYRFATAAVGGLAGFVLNQFATKPVQITAPVRKTIRDEEDREGDLVFRPGESIFTPPSPPPVEVYKIPDSAFDYDNYDPANYTDLDDLEPSVQNALILSRRICEDGNPMSLTLRQLEEIAKDCGVIEDLLPLFIAKVFADIVTFASMPAADSSEVVNLMAAVDWARKCKRLRWSIYSLDV